MFSSRFSNNNFMLEKRFLVKQMNSFDLRTEKSQLLPEAMVVNAVVKQCHKL